MRLLLLVPEDEYAQAQAIGFDGSPDQVKQAGAIQQYAVRIPMTVAGIAGEGCSPGASI